MTGAQGSVPLATAAGVVLGSEARDRGRVEWLARAGGPAETAETAPATAVTGLAG